MNRGRVGLVLGSEIPPEHLQSMARKAEEQGFAELWLSEDCFYTGGVSGAAIALSATTTMQIGLGITSAVTRHPAILAMEVSTLARAFPGRLRPAIGLGVPAWLGQLGLLPTSPLTAVRECTTALSALLRGDQVDTAGGQFTFDAVKLHYPVSEPLPIQLGVAGPKMLQLSGEIADGTLLSVLAGSRYVEWAREQITIGARRSGKDPDAHQITTFALCAIDPDSAVAHAAARAAVAFYLAAGGPNALTDAHGISGELAAMLSAGGPAEVERHMPAEWVDELCVAGTPDECSEKIDRLLAAGSDKVALFPTPAERADSTMELLASHVLPRFRPTVEPSTP